MKRSSKCDLSRRNFVRHAAGTVAAVSACGLSVTSANEPSTLEQGKDVWKPKLCTSSVMFGKLPIEEVCKIVSQLGLSGIDIWPTWAGQCTHLDDIKKQLGGKGLRELLTRYKLELAAMSIYSHQLSEYEELIRDFGGAIVIHGANGRDVSDPKELTPRLREMFEKMKPEIEVAEKCNARIAIENHGGSLLNSPDSFKAFVELNPNPERVGVAIAPYHLQAHKTPVGDTIKTAGSQALFIYAWQRGSGMQQMPGVGPVDFTPWLQAMADMDYSHYSTIFMHGHPAAEDMEPAVAKSYEYLQKIERKIAEG